MSDLRRDVLEAVACVQNGISFAPRDPSQAWDNASQEQFTQGIQTQIQDILNSQQCLDEVSEGLGILCRGRLVERVGERYDLHPLVRSYVRERGWQEKDDTGQTIQHSHAAYFLGYTGDHRADPRSLEQELDNIRAGFAAACGELVNAKRMVFL